MVDLDLTISNILDDATGLSLELVSGVPYVTITPPRQDVGTLASGDSLTVRFALAIADDAPYRSPITLYTRAVADSYEDTPDVLRFEANPGRLAHHRSGAIEVSITTEGNIGYLDLPSISPGRGFRAFDPSLGLEREFLLEGGLVIGIGNNAVVDCVSHSFNQSMDFVPKRGTELVIDSSGVVVAEHGSVTLLDNGSNDGLGLEILQESFVDTEEAHEDFIIFKYTIANTANRAHRNLHVGLYINWQVGLAFMSDIAHMDELRHLGYQTGPGSSILVGTKLLSSGAPFHHRAIDLFEELGFEGAFDDGAKWSMLSGGAVAAPEGTGTWSHMVASGPYSVDPQETIEVAFALVSGATEEDFLRNADAAQDLWESRLQTATGVQFIQNVAGAEVDLYVDDELVEDNWRFQSATRYLELEGGTHTADIVSASDADNTSPLAALEFDFATRSHNQIFAYGSSEEVRLAAVEDVRRSERGSTSVSFYFAHGARDAGEVTVRLSDEGGVPGMVIAEGIDFGEFGSYVELEAGSHDVQVVQAAGGSQIGIFRLELGGLEGESFVLNLSGIGASVAQGLGLLGVLPTGQAFVPVAVETSLAGAAELPEEFALRGNYPNPFNPATRIQFDLPARAAITVHVTDVLGRTVRILTGLESEAGMKRSVQISGDGLASGMYFYRITAEMEQQTATESGRMLLIR